MKYHWSILLACLFILVLGMLGTAFYFWHQTLNRYTEQQAQELHLLSSLECDTKELIRRLDAELSDAADMRCDAKAEGLDCVFALSAPMIPDLLTFIDRSVCEPDRFSIDVHPQSIELRMHWGAALSS